MSNSKPTSIASEPSETVNQGLEVIDSSNAKTAEGESRQHLKKECSIKEHTTSENDFAKNHNDEFPSTIRQWKKNKVPSREEISKARYKYILSFIGYSYFYID